MPISNKDLEEISYLARINVQEEDFSSLKKEPIYLVYYIILTKVKYIIFL